MSVLPVGETVAGAGLLGLTAVVLAGLLEVRGLVARTVAVFVLAAAVIVALIELLSLVHGLTPAGLLAGQAVIGAGGVLAWLRRGRPVLLPRPAVVPGPPRALIRAHPALTVLLVAVAVALLFEGFLAVAVAPNEADSLGYHLPRAAYWLQHHSALQYQPGQLDDPQLVSPPNGEMLLAWTMALSRSDRLAQLVQWFALLASCGAITLIARSLGYRRSAALWAAGLFALMPEVLLQASTAQNDILLTALLLASGLFLARGLRDRHLGEASVGAVALGLAAGTKLSFALALPALLLVLAPALLRARAERALLARVAGLVVLGVLALGSFNYVQNIIYTHNLTGFSGTPSGDFVKSGPLIDAGRVAWDLVDAPGMPQPAWLQRTVDHVVNPLFDGVRGSSFSTPEPPIRSESNEDESAYGLVGFLILVPLLVLTLFRRRAGAAPRLVAAAAASFFGAYVIGLGYTPEAARYLMPAVALGAALLACTARRRTTRWLTLLLALAVVPATILHDNNKEIVPASGDRPILTQDRLSQQTVDADLAPIAPVIRRLDQLIGPHDGVGFLQQDNIRDYLLFGEPLQRRVVGFDPPQLTPAGIRSAHVRGVLIAYTDQPPCHGPTCLASTTGLRVERLGPTSIWVTPGQ